MDDLIAFGYARLGEDEAGAQAAAQSGNQFTEPGGHDPRWQRDPGHNGGEIRDMCSPRGCIVVFDEGSPGPEQAAHIARHDPARVLREVAAGRAILTRYQDHLARMEDPGYPQAVARDQAREYEDYVLPALAAIWSDHPDYRPEWKP